MSSYFGMSSYSWDEFLIQNFKNISFLTEIQSHVLVVTKISLCEDHSEVTYNPKDSCKKFSILGGCSKKKDGHKLLSTKISSGREIFRLYCYILNAPTLIDLEM